MFRIPDDFSSQISQAVGAAESQTTAELVVVLAHRSRSYWSTALHMTMWLIYGFLNLILFSHFEVHPFSLSLELPILAGLIAWFCAKSPRLIQRFTFPSTLRRAVKSAAHATFYEERVFGTREHTGILIYISILEKRVELVMDGGVLQHISPAELGAVQWSSTSDNPHDLGQMADVINGIGSIGHLCATHLPRLGEAINELPNEPVVRPW